jgi:hypothetical protein
MKYRILSCRVGAGPETVEVESPWQYTKEFIDTTESSGRDSYIEAVCLEDGVLIYCDEEGMIKKLPINRLLPARAPEIDEESFFVIYREGLAHPGEMGIHVLRGNFILTRHDVDTDEPRNLTDEDIKKYTRILGGQPPCPKCGRKPSEAGLVYCGGDTCAAKAGVL